jgi:hypothetical protein
VACETKGKPSSWPDVLKKRAMPGLLGGRSDVESRGAECQPGYPTTPLHSGSRFVGHQQSKGNKYQVEVVFKVSTTYYTGHTCYFFLFFGSLLLILTSNHRLSMKLIKMGTIP